MTVEYEAYLHNKLDLMLERGSDLVEKAMKTAALCLSGQLLKNAQVNRQASAATGGSTSTRDLSNIDITDEDREDMKTWGYSEKASQATLL